MGVAKKKNPFYKYILTFVGTFLMAIAVNMVYEPLGMVTGGFSGLSIVVKEVTKTIVPGGLPLGIFNVLSNVPLFIAAIIIMGSKYIKRTLFATISFSLALFIVPTFEVLYEDYLLAAVFGGVITGVGIGLVFSTSSSTGGTDLLASIIHKYKKYYSIPQILVAIDAVIVLVGAMVFGFNKALYAIIAIFLSSKVSDAILEGLKFAKMAYIISDKYLEIADQIMNVIQRGATKISITGMYSNKEKHMLFCVVTKKEIIQIIEITKKIDPQSFVIINDVREVMGEGFVEQ